MRRRPLGDWFMWVVVAQRYGCPAMGDGVEGRKRTIESGEVEHPGRAGGWEARRLGGWEACLVGAGTSTRTRTSTSTIVWLTLSNAFRGLLGYIKG